MTDPLTASELDKLSDMVRRLNPSKAAQRLGIHRSSLLAILAKTSVHDGTVALVRAALEKEPVQS